MQNRGMYITRKQLFTLIPCIRDIALRGRRALSVRIVLNAWMPPAPTSEAVKLMRETWTPKSFDQLLSWKSIHAEPVYYINDYILAEMTRCLLVFNEITVTVQHTFVI